MLNFDLESNGLLDTISKIHCMVIGTVDDKEERTRYNPSTVLKGVDRLEKALARGEVISGHNIINYDIPAFEKVTKFKMQRKWRKYVLDSLVLGRLIYPNMKQVDIPLVMRKKLPGKLQGRHSLKAYGYRLNVLKDEFGVEEDEEGVDKWATFTPTMLNYNEQDVVVGTALIKHLIAAGYSEEAIVLEHDVAWLMSQQERNGFHFNKKKAEELEIVLRARAEVARQQIEKVVPPIPAPDFIPKRDNKRLGYVKGVPVKRFKEFNPNSRQQFGWIITQYFNFHPDNIELYNIPDDDKKKYDSDEILSRCIKGKYPLKIDEETFKAIRSDPTAPPEILPLAEHSELYFMLGKRLGQLADGKYAWLKCVKEDGFMHGSVNPMGCVTSRASHSSPNMGQIPAVDSEYGPECRELFEAPPGWYQVGVDACGLELRCLAHYMYPYDNGEYADIILNGDIHTANQEAAGLPERGQAKTFIYAFLYGAGDAKIGKIVNGSASHGKALKKRFLEKTPGIALLRKAIEDQLVETKFRGRVKKWRRKWLKGLDGRKIPIRYVHAALNSLLQSCGAILCKYWIVETERMLVEEYGLKHGWDGDFAFMAWVHDEFQSGAKDKSTAELIVKVAQEAMRRTQAHYGFRVQLDTEGKIGKNWKDCH